MLYMFHTHVANVCSKCSSALDICCIQVFHVLDVCPESYGGTTQTPGTGRGNRGPANGAC
jgi:hypothetical protein